MIATQLFVVPRSMPMILPMVISTSDANWVDCAADGGFCSSNQGATSVAACASRRSVLGFGHGDHRRPQNAIREQIAFLEHLRNRVGRLGTIDHRHRLVL